MKRIETLQEVVIRTPKQQEQSIAQSTCRVRKALSKQNKKYNPAVPALRMHEGDDVMDHYLDD